MHHVKISAIGNSAGIILSKDLLAHLGVDKGDSLSVVKTPDGVEFRTYDSVFEEQMTVARRIMKERRAVLRELAK